MYVSSSSELFKEVILLTSSFQRSSLLSKIKSYFSSDSRVQEPADGSTSLGVATFNGPGGFYSRDTVDLPGRVVMNAKLEPNSNDNNLGDTEEAKLPNLTLAQFFREKGDEPLSEIEYEGVLSLIKRSKSASLVEDTQNALMAGNNSSELSSAVLKPSSVREASLKAPSFRPKYDEFASTANTSLRSVVSAGSRKSRVFDYSSLPSPYRSCSYRHSTTDAILAQKNTAGLESSGADAFSTSSDKMSNTASALISLLDSREAKSEASGLANPYSTRVSEFKRYRRDPESDRFVPHTPSKANGASSPAHSIALSEIQNNENKEAETTEKPTNQQFTKYRPAKASSLRTTVSAKKSPGAESSKPLGSVPHLQETDAPVVPKSSFGFSYPALAMSFDKSSRNANSANSTGKMAAGVSEEGTETKPASSMNTKTTPSFNFSQQLGARKANSPAQTSLAAFAKESDQSSARKANEGQSSRELQSAFSNNEPLQFDFSAPPASGIDPASIDEELVQKSRNIYVF